MLMFLQKHIKAGKVLKVAKISNFFKNGQNHGFWNFDSWFLSWGEKATENYCLYECKDIIMKKNERISLSSTQYCVLLLNLFVTLRQSDSSTNGKNGALLSWNLQTTPQRQKKNVALYTVTT